jgi:hypothetical protein
VFSGEPCRGVPGPGKASEVVEHVKTYCGQCIGISIRGVHVCLRQSVFEKKNIMKRPTANKKTATPKTWTIKNKVYILFRTKEILQASNRSIAPTATRPH